MSSYKKLIIWVAVGLSSLVTIAVIVIGIKLYDANGVSTIVREQLSALHDHDIVLAYSYTSKDFQNSTSLEAFKSFVQSYPIITDNKSISIMSKDIKSSEGFIEGNLLSSNGNMTPIEYRLVKENGKWKILSLRLKVETLQTSNISPDSSKAANPPAADNSVAIEVSNIALPNTYEDKRGKYTINFPSDWEYEQPDKSSVVIGGKKGTGAYDSTVNIQTVLAKSTSNLKTFINSLKREAKDQSKDVEFLGEGQIDLPATTNHPQMKGRYIVFTYTFDGQKYRQLQFVFQRSDNSAFYAWGYTAPSDRYDIDYPTAKAMFASWKVFPN